MELVPGMTLREHLDDTGALTAPEAVTIGVQVAEALAPRTAPASCTATSSRPTSCSPTTGG